MKKHVSKFIVLFLMVLFLICIKSYFFKQKNPPVRHPDFCETDEDCPKYDCVDCWTVCDLNRCIIMHKN